MFTPPHFVIESFSPLDGSLTGIYLWSVTDVGEKGVFGDLNWVSCQFASLMPSSVAAFPSSSPSSYSL
jgi:hypothetical protein